MLPGLIPKRKQWRSTEYLVEPLMVALDRFTGSCYAPRLEHPVICFSHVYSRALPERRVRDYDNLELKQYQDAVAAYLLTDDSGLLCDTYNTTELGETECTILTVMERGLFPEWLAEREIRASGA